MHPVDVAIALGLGALSFLPFVTGSANVATAGGLPVVLLLLESLPLVWRRRYPLIVMLVVLTRNNRPHRGASRRERPSQVGLGILVATYTIGERLDRPTSLGLTALTATMIAVLFIGQGGPDALQSLIQTDLILFVAWLVGDAARIRQLYAENLVEQARLVDREREERTRRAVLEERERIARELHDVVAHHVSVMVIQAGGGLSAIATRPDDARSALQSIATTGRLALSDMRRMLGVLGKAETQEPMPGLDRLDDLVTQVRLAGLPVELSVEGERRRLDPGLELSAYRIVQEALTNSLKHAQGGRAHVVVAFEPGLLVISIDDERGLGPRPAVEPDHEGRGLVGMRERVAMLRGTLVAQPTTGGFRVVASLPIEAAPAQ